MTAKEYLRQYLYAEMTINTELEEIERLYALAEKTTTSFNRGAVRSSKRDKMTVVDTIVDLQQRTKKDIKNLRAIKVSVVAVINAVPDNRRRNVLHLRYICGNKWEQIAVKMNYDYRWVLRLHGSALKDVEQILATQSHIKK